MAIRSLLSPACFITVVAFAGLLDFISVDGFLFSRVIYILLSIKSKNRKESGNFRRNNVYVFGIYGYLEYGGSDGAAFYSLVAVGTFGGG